MNNIETNLNPDGEEQKEEVKQRIAETYGFTLHLEKAYLLPKDTVKEGDGIKIAWRRNKGSLKTQAVKVTDGSATVDQSLSLNTEMVYDRPTKSFMRPLTTYLQ